MRDRIHILFSCAAASSLRKALAEEGRGDEVIHFSDDLSYGSISSLNPDARLEALIGEGFANRADEGEWLPHLSREFWTRCAATDLRRTLWVAPRSGEEMAGYLAYMGQFGDWPCDIVRMDEVEHRLPDEDIPRPVLQTSQLWPHQFRTLWDHARQVRPQEAISARQLWRRLVEENAKLRVPGGEGLLSVPETLFDEYLLRECPSTWGRAVRIMARAMGPIWEERHYAVGVIYLDWRVKKLVEQGVLESREDISGWSFSQCRENEPEIRKPPA